MGPEDNRRVEAYHRMRQEMVTVRVEHLADDVGVWCDSCALPSAMRRTFAVSIGPRTSVGAGVICLDCGRHRIVS